MKKKLILPLVITLLVIILIGTAAFFMFRYKPTPEEKAVLDQLKEEGITADKVKIKEDKVIIDYAQPIDFTNEDGELYATWAYIFSVAADMNPNALTIIINCKFKDGEEVRLTIDKETVTSFINEELSPTEFLQKIKVKPLTKGPKI